MREIVGPERVTLAVDLHLPLPNATLLAPPTIACAMCGACLVLVWWGCGWRGRLGVRLPACALPVAVLECGGGEDAEFVEGEHGDEFEEGGDGVGAGE
jgi:hypothetical protein